MTIFTGCRSQRWSCAESCRHLSFCLLRRGDGGTVLACCRPVRSMSVRSSGEELITVSKDAVILWNLKVKW